VTNSRDASDFREGDSLLTALLMPLLIGGKPSEEGCTVNSHQDCGIDSSVSLQVGMILRARSFRFDQPLPAANNLRASVRGWKWRHWALDADRLGTHAQMMQRRSYPRARKPIALEEKKRLPPTRPSILPAEQRSL
jgi:hypothetical protein